MSACHRSGCSARDSLCRSISERLQQALDTESGAGRSSAPYEHNWPDQTARSQWNGEMNLSRNEKQLGPTERSEGAPKLSVAGCAEESVRRTTPPAAGPFESGL